MNSNLAFLFLEELGNTLIMTLSLIHISEPTRH